MKMKKRYGIMLPNYPEELDRLVFEIGSKYWELIVLEVDAYFAETPSMNEFMRIDQVFTSPIGTE